MSIYNKQMLSLFFKWPIWQRKCTKNAHPIVFDKTLISRIYLLLSVKLLKKSDCLQKLLSLVLAEKISANNTGFPPLYWEGRTDVP